MTTTLPAITVWQPWASMIAEGIKPYEFRTWKMPRQLWRRRVAIHAGARVMPRSELLFLLRRLESDGADGQALDVERAIPFLRSVIADPASLPRSSVLCTATLGEPIPPSEVWARWANDSNRDAHFNWAWPLESVRRLTPPVPARGAQGFWRWTPPADAQP